MTRPALTRKAGVFARLLSGALVTALLPGSAWLEAHPTPVLDEVTHSRQTPWARSQHAPPRERWKALFARYFGAEATTGGPAAPGGAHGLEPGSGAIPAAALSWIMPPAGAAAPGVTAGPAGSTQAPRTQPAGQRISGSASPPHAPRLLARAPGDAPDLAVLLTRTPGSPESALRPTEPATTRARPGSARLIDLTTTRAPAGPIHLAPHVTAGPVGLATRATAGPIHLAPHVTAGPVGLPAGVTAGPIGLATRASAATIHLARRVTAGPINLGTRVTAGPINLATRALTAGAPGVRGLPAGGYRRGTASPGPHPPHAGSFRALGEFGLVSPHATGVASRMTTERSFQPAPARFELLTPVEAKGDGDAVVPGTSRPPTLAHGASASRLHPSLVSASRLHLSIVSVSSLRPSIASASSLRPSLVSAPGDVVPQRNTLSAPIRLLGAGLDELPHALRQARTRPGRLEERLGRQEGPRPSSSLAPTRTQHHLATRSDVAGPISPPPGTSSAPQASSLAAGSPLTPAAPQTSRPTLTLLEPVVHDSPPPAPPTLAELQNQFIEAVARRQGATAAAQLKATLEQGRRTRWDAPSSAGPHSPTGPAHGGGNTASHAASPPPSSRSAREKEPAPPAVLSEEAAVLQVLRSLTTRSPEALALLREVSEALSTLRRVKSYRKLE